MIYDQESRKYFTLRGAMQRGTRGLALGLGSSNMQVSPPWLMAGYLWVIQSPASRKTANDAITCVPWFGKRPAFVTLRLPLPHISGQPHRLAGIFLDGRYSACLSLLLLSTLKLFIFSLDRGLLPPPKTEIFVGFCSPSLFLPPSLCAFALFFSLSLSSPFFLSTMHNKCALKLVCVLLEYN